MARKLIHYLTNFLYIKYFVSKLCEAVWTVFRILESLWGFGLLDMRIQVPSWHWRAGGPEPSVFVVDFFPNLRKLSQYQL